MQSPVRTDNRNKYVKVSGRPCLYRHRRSGRYHAAIKISGKRYDRSLRTTDRWIAERRLDDLKRNLRLLDREVERLTLRGLIQKFVAISQGKSLKTRKTNRSILRKIEHSWPNGVDVEVRQIKPSHLEMWLAFHEKRLKNTTYNRYASVLRQMFQIAVRDRIIARSPFDEVRTKWKKPEPPIRVTPTEGQFRAIVTSIRSQLLTDHAQDSANFVEFLGLAGLGQAEAGSLAWGNIDFEAERLHVRRHKTNTWFYVPLYPDLKRMLLRLRKSCRKPSKDKRVFAIKDAKKALRAACDRLGLPNFSHRAIRRHLIRKLWRAGVDKKLIAKWQGHQDGGQLIIDTYTEAFGDDDADYEQRELAKLLRPAA
jgi:integrase